MIVFVKSIHAILKRFVMQMPTVPDVFSSFCPSLSLKEMKLFLTSRKQMSSCVSRRRGLTGQTILRGFPQYVCAYPLTSSYNSQLFLL
jgi:hypothetical protein